MRQYGAVAEQCVERVHDGPEQINKVRDLGSSDLISSISESLRA